MICTKCSIIVSNTFSWTFFLVLFVMLSTYFFYVEIFWFEHNTLVPCCNKSKWFQLLLYYSVTSNNHSPIFFSFSFIHLILLAVFSMACWKVRLAVLILSLLSLNWATNCWYSKSVFRLKVTPAIRLWRRKKPENLGGKKIVISFNMAIGENLNHILYCMIQIFFN